MLSEASTVFISYENLRLASLKLILDMNVWTKTELCVTLCYRAVNSPYTYSSYFLREVSEADIKIIEKKLLNTHNVIISKKRRIAMQRYSNRGSGNEESGGWFNMIKRSVASQGTQISQQGKFYAYNTLNSEKVVIIP